MRFPHSLRRRSPTKRKLPLFKHLRLAFSFLTIFPISVDSKDKKVTLSQSMACFPFVGIIIALVSLSIFYFIEPFTSLRFASLLLVLMPILLSGGLHVDGLADCFDAFFQGKDRDDILRVMKDSRIGVWGALSILFMVLLKWELIMILPSKVLSFIFALSVARWSQVFLCYLLPYARKEKGLGQQVAGAISPRELFLGLLFIILIGFPLGLIGLAVFILSTGIVFLLSRYYKHKLNGITGDVIGATSEITECIVLILIIVLSRTGVFY